MHLLEKNQDKTDWDGSSRNPLEKWINTFR
jgi:hypothetical protein